LRYSTNLSTLKYKSSDLVEYWNNFDSVWFMCSIDHFGEKLEYIRQNVNDKKIWKNLERLIENNFKISITFVVSIYNIYYLDDFFQYLDNKGYLDKVFSIDPLYVFGETDSPAVLPDFAKKELIEKLNRDNKTAFYQSLFEQFPMLKDAVEGLPKFIYEDCKISFEDFLSRVYSFDSIYGKDIKRTFPWLARVIDKFENEKTKL